MASYAHVTVDGVRRQDLLWCYVAAFPEAQAVAGYWAVDDSADDVEVRVG